MIDAGFHFHAHGQRIKTVQTHLQIIWRYTQPEHNTNTGQRILNGRIIFKSNPHRKIIILQNAKQAQRIPSAGLQIRF